MKNQTIDNTQAVAEGWMIIDAAEAGWQLRYDPKESLLDSDQDAWFLVYAKASEGSAYHQAALDFLKEHGLSEYDQIMRFVETGSFQPRDGSGNTTFMR